MMMKRMKAKKIKKIKKVKVMKGNSRRKIGKPNDAVVTASGCVRMKNTIVN
jgi:hypothetical protein